MSPKASLATTHSAIRAFWEEEGARYDHKDAHGIFSESEHRLWTTVLGEITPPSRVLDIATGTGFVALLLAELGHQVTGLDASQAMLANARTKATERGLSITFVEGVTEQLPFPDAGFDAVTARHFIWTLVEPAKAFAEWRRVLTPGGTLVADCSLDAQVAAHHYADDVAAALPFSGVGDPAPVVDALRAAGFGAVDVEILGGDEQRRRAVLRARA
ncbi:class I SAM-dependent methyltransferase [Mycobacterium sherrisii]|uniref:Ubiquinone biosynthesis protein UbiE n=1 Tax=Mycobacterium sherrisii TaxID=243061 RepID=A0A1E3T4S9_9MYCO|nr:methyltransferase domain-containing protein [Mycobacterium sherrisii]MCV7030139.1 methyltransferase domain-containing protein [Mycobacterium sherrisii]MEC4762437.1 methyltransferase domain-containing protein [Mycobacterium sherrisii]ODR09331.1 ubiquinone biosynthesis protein UbiE [Mycobacterium sherrisii]ORW86524.1 ubiquinone biosynthesis protein UbiE [Mycobacterium sherrisii]